MQNVLIAGGSGLIGLKLTKLLQQNGYEVAWLTRRINANNPIKQFEWNPDLGTINPQAIAFANCIVNLAGSSVAGKRWTNSYKKQILNSRVASTQLLVKSLTQTPNSVISYITASAIGIYGNNTPLNTTEEASIAKNFLADVCYKWELAAMPLLQTNIRCVTLRIGVVLAAEGGFVYEVAKPIKFGLGSCLGNGKQYISWIEGNDLVNMFLFAIRQNHIAGTYNAVAPNPETNRELTYQLAQSLNKPIWLPNLPAFAVKLLFGEMGSVLLASQHVSSQKIVQQGFKFNYENATDALKGLLN